MDEITIIIDEEFRDLLPALDKKTYEALEENLLENGCMFPLVVWGDILIDGFNRYRICQEHDISFGTVNKEFESRDDALIWIISNQVSRRNLTPMQLSYFRGLHYNADKRIVTNATGRNQFSEVDVQNEHQPRMQSTAGRLSKQYNVSPMTIRRDAQTAVAINALGVTSPEAKSSVLSGETSITRKQLSELLSGSDEDIRLTAATIKEGTFERRPAVASTSAEPDSPVKVILSYMLPFSSAIGRLSDILHSGLPGITDDSDKAALRAALRSCIDDLEVLCARI